MRLAVLVLVLATALPASAQGPTLLAGGGALPPDALAWFAGHARGDSVLVVDYHAEPSARVVDGLRAAGAAVAWLRVPDALAADDAGVAARVARAGALFFPGGDQQAYTAAWRGRAVARAAAAAWQAGTAVGGTSAGAMILSATSFVARDGSVAARDAVADPFAPALALEPGAVPLLAGVVVETHVAERGRIGRMAAFVARHRADTGHWTAALGVDDATALAVAPDGTGTVYGTGVATWLAVADTSAAAGAWGLPPLRMAQVAAGGTLHVRTGAVALEPTARAFRARHVAWTRRRTALAASRPGVAVTTGAWGDPEGEEARVGGWAAAAVRDRAAWAVLVPEDARAWIGRGALGTDGGVRPLLVLDLRAARRAGRPAARANGTFEGRLHLVPPGRPLDLTAGP